MKPVLVGAILSTAASGQAVAQDRDLMTFVFGGALSISLQEFDDCLFEGVRIREFSDMTAHCQDSLQPCHRRMHLPHGGVPRDAGRRALLERCLREDAGRYQVLMQRHLIDVLDDLPGDADDDARQAALQRFVDTPAEAAAEAHRFCGAARPETDVVRLSCARDVRRDAVLRGRQAIMEARQ